MRSEFLDREWSELCDRLHQCALHHGRSTERRDSFVAAAESFRANEPPSRYSELLDRVAAAAQLAKAWQAIGCVDQHDDATIDEAAAEPSPASDPSTEAATGD